MLIVKFFSAVGSAEPLVVSLEEQALMKRVIFYNKFNLFIIMAVILEI